MRFRELTLSDERLIRSFTQDCWMCLPFYPSYSEGTQALLTALAVQSEQSVWGVFDEGRLIGVLLLKMQQTTCQINHLLMAKSRARASMAMAMLERMGKELWAERVRLNLTAVPDMFWQEQLLAAGYEALDQWQKKISYRTALVLGGGGARGAYQVGVWQALVELGISFDIITGTSVGALNGGLILNGDLAAAKKMWEEIDTQQILSFPAAQGEADSFGALLEQIGSMMTTAIQSAGVSTKPLAELIERNLDEDTIAKAPQEFYLVTTQIPEMKECQICLADEPLAERSQWFLASASFFPAMAAAKIGKHYYVDGGYRNNIPVDAALAAGATECVIVDVKGPGITKAVKIPDRVAQWTLRTPWTTGSVLLFDGTRSAQNIQLGYLEALKCFGGYQGFWYTFVPANFVSAGAALWQEFGRFVTKRYPALPFSKQIHAVCRRLRKVYKDRVSPENLWLVILELSAKNLQVSPATCYSLTEFIELITMSPQPIVQQTGLLSVQEWLHRYYEEFFLLSERRQGVYLTNFLANEPEKRSERIQLLWDRLPQLVIFELFREFLQQRGE